MVEAMRSLVSFPIHLSHGRSNKVNEEYARLEFIQGFQGE